MIAFLGLPWRRKPLTDGEFVEKIRKDLQRMQRVGKWLIAFNAVMIVACLYVAVRLIQFVCDFAANLPQGNFVIPGLVLGVVMGLMLGGMVHRAGEGMGRALLFLKGDRKDLLLLKYHDLLQQQGYLDEEPKEEASL